MTNVFSSLQELSKSAANFSWALSVFGLSQASKVAQGIPAGDPGGAASQSFDATATAIKQQLDGLTSLFEAGQQTLDSGLNAIENAADCAAEASPVPLPAPTPTPLPAPTPPVVIPPQAQAPKTLFPHELPPSVNEETSNPDAWRHWERYDIPGVQQMEEVFVSFSRGNGHFSTDLGPPTYINLLVDMYDMHGKWIGYQAGVNKTFEPPEASLSVKPRPDLPIDQGPVPETKASAWTKAIFTFNDGAMNVEGPAMTHLIRLTSGDLLFLVTTSHVINSGTGAYEGARGTKQATGTGLIPKALFEAGKFPSPGLVFPVTTIETFRLIRNQYLVEAVSGRRSR